jgi:hypothetical protein
LRCGHTISGACVRIKLTPPRPIWSSPAGSRPGTSPRARVATPGRSVAGAAGGITCRIVVRRRPTRRWRWWWFGIAPCPRRDAGPFRGVGSDGRHLPDRGDHHRPVPASRRGAGPSRMGRHLPDRGQARSAPCPRRDAGAFRPAGLGSRGREWRPLPDRGQGASLTGRGAWLSPAGSRPGDYVLAPTLRRRGVPRAAWHRRPSPAGLRLGGSATHMAPCPRRDAGTFRWVAISGPSPAGSRPAVPALCPRRDAGPCGCEVGLAITCRIAARRRWPPRARVATPGRSVRHVAPLAITCRIATRQRHREGDRHHHHRRRARVAVPGAHQAARGRRRHHACRIAAGRPRRWQSRSPTSSPPCPRRDAGPFHRVGTVGHHLPDRGQGATGFAPCPRRDAGAVRPGRPSPAGSRPGGGRHVGSDRHHIPRAHVATPGRCPGWAITCRIAARRPTTRRRRWCGKPHRPVPTSRRRGVPARGRVCGLAPSRRRGQQPRLPPVNATRANGGPRGRELL